MRLKLLFLSLLITSFSSYSEWYESQGEAFINNGDTKAAKTQAMENALKKVLLVAGASVSSVQQVINGLLTHEEMNIRASGSINSLELVSETYSDDTVTVNIRADIFPQEKQCFSADYRKSILLTRSNLLHQEQANIGSIYAIDTLLMKKLAEKIQNDTQYLSPKLSLKNKTPFSRLNQSMNSEDIKSMTRSLADTAGTQYVMYSEINDISFAHASNNEWQFWQESRRNRHFELSTYVYDGENGELISQKNYQSTGEWTFTKRAQIDTNSQTFWRSNYGNMINQTLNNITLNLDNEMMCEPTRGKIAQVTGNKIIINLGRRQGLKIGDEFSLLHANNFTSDSGKTYAGFNISPYKVKITQLSRDSAHAVTLDEHILDNIQIGDTAVRY
jgi:hypothetical protein